MRERVPRLIVATLVPALALEVAFPILERFTTVYNRPTELLPGLFLDVCLVVVRAILLAVWVRSNLLFAVGVLVFAMQSVGVAVEIAKTDDAQAGLAALALPFYTGAVAVALIILDLYLRWRRDRAVSSEATELAKSSEDLAPDR
jgi:hypothetical protein